MKRIFVCKTGELASGEARKVEVNPAVAVFNVDGVFYAVADRCSHGNASMSEGYVEDDATVECPLHAARFCLKTGAAQCLPATEPLRTFPVAVAGDELYVEISEEVAA
ncbi:bifunctional 3-phenylpropionate/cinnamic acid dioxygenase ferredoxin subunit [Crenobacter sp. SG2303]|uniref:Bifunctional 3-phenylpropionate/cinnamic acid dioxygenase ferredoxin subunit n=1 Tax=Crenobacter oryzisoli TaxID=3056844 RepID=A0ABT7XRI4_9NEIS|nr:3-phenylpropionate/cinnamic acid dioxygenase ferredoxin subunit [Crenobacter sp. SG2303]MDN0076408.1 bifunctional 3-phenylpropionate/cinnamic acid dioxygenase ferredoxin subunit [Crenobacter sp. SG2303]